MRRFSVRMSDSGFRKSENSMRRKHAIKLFQKGQSVWQMVKGFKQDDEVVCLGFFRNVITIVMLKKKVRITFCVLLRNREGSRRDIYAGYYCSGFCNQD